MKALRLSLGFAQRPKDVLKQLFSTKAPPQYAVDPQRRRYWKALWSDFKKTGVYRLIYYLRPDSTPPSLTGVEKAAFAFGFGLFFSRIRQYMLQSRRRQLSRAFRSKNPAQILISILFIPILFVYFVLFPFAFVGIAFITTDIILSYYGFGMEAMPTPLHLLFLFEQQFMEVVVTPWFLFFAIGALILIIMFFLSFLTLVFKFVRLSIARVVRLFLQGPGAWVMGLVVRNAAFGGQCQKVLRPQELPEKECARTEAISDKLNQKMKDLSRKTGAQAGEALYSALAEGDAMKIKEHIFERLTDPKLAHCQYYCEDEIIDRIAELIAAPLSSVASGFDLSKPNGLFSAQ
jgi:hypothetical protein